VTRRRAGTVVTFDRDVGLGEVRLEDGTVLGFHATELRDGTRDVAVGASVTARCSPGRAGRYEATAIEVDEGAVARGRAEGAGC